MLRVNFGKIFAHNQSCVQLQSIKDIYNDYKIIFKEYNMNVFPSVVLDKDDIQRLIKFLTEILATEE